VTRVEARRLVHQAHLVIVTREQQSTSLTVATKAIPYKARVIAASLMGQGQTCQAEILASVQGVSEGY